MNNTTELIFILDKSGSMAGLESDTMGGFNALIEKQKKIEGEAFVSTVLFSDKSLVLHDRMPIGEIAPLTEEDYQVGGCTALLDALGDAMHHIKTIHKYIRKEDVPEKTMFVITTDGMENASRRYSALEVKKMIRTYEEKYGWEFLFVAANIDAAETAESIGISKERAANYRATEKGTQKMYAAVADAVCSMRMHAPLPANWSEGLDEE